MAAEAHMILVVNSGSSSVKYELFSMGPQRSMLEGEVERIGGDEPTLWQETRESRSSRRVERPVAAADHAEAMRRVIESLADAGVLAETCGLLAIGHRVVHGGDTFTDPVVIDDDVIARIREFGLFAPVHVGANLAGIAAARAACPDVPHVAVFDTAFHRTMPAHAREYALPRTLAREHRIRRYGFHGTSHANVAQEAARYLRRPLEELNFVTLHLGNGASATAIRRGVSVDTSMGMTPLEGLVMGTRCGDVDPAVPLLIRELTGASREDVHRILNYESGLVGLCGERDMRAVHELAAGGDRDAVLALEMFCYRVKKYVGAYFAVLGHVDAIVFTAGIGENDADVRTRVCSGLELLGVALDEERNGAAGDGARVISAHGSRVAVLVIPTDEEGEIARLAYECVTKE